MKDQMKIHFFYIVAILLAIIIILVTVRWYEIPNLIDYFNFALTLTSISLALLAIIYAFISNSTFAKNIFSLNEISIIIKKNAEELNLSTELLKSELVKIPKSLDSLEQKADSTLTHLNEIRNKALLQPDANEKITEGLSIDNIKKLLRHTSINGMKLLFILKYSYKYQKSFLLSKVLEDLKFSSWDYAYGFYIPLNGLGVFSYKEIREDNYFKWLINEVDKYLYENIEYELKELIAEVEYKSAFENFWKEIKEVEEYFINIPV